MIKLSIIIVNWNTKDLLLSCIKSIIQSKPQVAYEIIVVDNGSTDSSVEEVKKLRIDKLRIFRNKDNLGYSKSNNKGIKKANGEYVLLLNSDTRLKHRAIDSLYNFAKDRSDIGVVGSRLLNPDGTIQASCFRFPTVAIAIKEYWLNQKGLFTKYAPLGDDPSEVDVVVGASFLITPQALKKVGLLNEDYFFFFEDLDYCREVKKAGLKVYYLPSSQVIHYHGSTVRKVTTKGDSWRNLIPGSKIYHGYLNHYIINFIIWSGQRWRKIFGQL